MKFTAIPSRQGVRRLAATAMATIAAFTAMAAAAQDFAGTDEKICGFFDNVNGLLNLASIAVVTIAVIFAGYQIAFAHKRISDVAPILIGGLLIGAASQIAKMLIGDTGESCVAMVNGLLPVVYA
ncbi:TrbC/VirB2 family protein [Vulcaniibacterium gelatinicum]|uniref:TrbC/VirB2 family protein n=1 Tax=Vulcaniibacterium gelatinicum TaxID=2598725 RepID=UPI0011C7DDC4|nr:TrbC/VirB2 family protein [Vulcaniibacterium gelatinicum]